jgi:Fe-S cluster biogenesis protein NfuA
MTETSQTAEQLAEQLKDQQDLFIQPVFSPQEDLLVLQVSMPILLRGRFDFPDMASAAEAPLAEALFAIKGVKTISLTVDKVEVALKSLDDWATAPNQTIETIKAHLQSGVPTVNASAYEADPGSEGSGQKHPLFFPIKQFLDNEVNPAVATHGGKIDLIGVKDSVAYVEMSGGCQGCSSANATLRPNERKIS